MVLTSDDKIVLAGQTSSGVLLERCTADGHPDPIFGSSGHQHPQNPERGAARTCALSSYLPNPVL
jgi:hypothetical protein